jgi:hypothetical protein
MTTIPQMECCTMLGIDPKTLRNWLRHAHLQFVAHPTDARLKCLTVEQVQQLAALHARPLQPPAAASAVLRQEASPLASTLSPPAPTQESETPLACATPSLPEEAELRKAVSALEAKVLTLQEHLAQLSLELLRERSERYERRLSSLEALLSQSVPGLPAKTEGVPVVDHHKARPSQRPLLPVELQARARVLPRVEMGAAGSYVLICPQEGELSFPTDSQDWFDWLCSLSSFRFLGQSGRFTAYREGQRSWRAYRSFQGRTYKQSLGTTDRLTIARLELVAGILQSRMAERS